MLVTNSLDLRLFCITIHTALVITAAATDEMNPVANTDVTTGWARKCIVQQIELSVQMMFVYIFQVLRIEHKATTYFDILYIGCISCILKICITQLMFVVANCLIHTKCIGLFYSILTLGQTSPYSATERKSVSFMLCCPVGYIHVR